MYLNLLMKGHKKFRLSRSMELKHLSFINVLKANCSQSYKSWDNVFLNSTQWNKIYGTVYVMISLLFTSHWDPYAVISLEAVAYS